MRVLRPLLLLVLLLSQAGCFGYRLVRPEEIDLPSYEPRNVPIPAECDALIRRAGTSDPNRITEAEGRALSFCQNQQIIRAQEEEAAARKLEAHAQAANFALQIATVAIGALIAILAWAF
ncbi:MAG TPA: hypothetical protein VGR37_05805 [Longimicrobiaceae bacterium]|nr:hypothetical protein [Longimicrobiaceae bacterium]